MRAFTLKNDKYVIITSNICSLHQNPKTSSITEVQSDLLGETIILHLKFEAISFDVVTKTKYTYKNAHKITRNKYIKT